MLMFLFELCYSWINQQLILMAILKIFYILRLMFIPLKFINWLLYDVTIA